MNGRHYHFGDEQPKPARIMPLPVALIVVPLSLIGAVLIECLLLAYELAHAAIDVLLVGNEKAQLRRRFK